MDHSVDHSWPFNFFNFKMLVFGLPWVEINTVFLHFVGVSIDISRFVIKRQPCLSCGPACTLPLWRLWRSIARSRIWRCDRRWPLNVDEGGYRTSEDCSGKIGKLGIPVRQDCTCKKRQKKQKERTVQAFGSFRHATATKYSVPKIHPCFFLVPKSSKSIPSHQIPWWLGDPSPRNLIAKRGAVAMAEAVRCNDVLESLDMNSNEVGERGVAGWAEEKDVLIRCIYVYIQVYHICIYIY